VEPSDHLLVISVECSAAPPATMRTVWEDRLTGHRRTDVEMLVDAPALLQRLAELVPLLVPPAAAVEPAPAGGDRRAA
jgi:hypothetical protein